jgi:adenylosuccinate lyase
MSLGMKFAMWWDELTRAGDNLALAVGSASVGKISGAVGTYANVDPRVEEQVCRALGIRPAAVSSQIVPRDRHARYLFALALLGSVIARQALEIRLLARTEASEIMEGFAKKQKGSSAMPHKRNPVKCEQLCGLARLLRANAMAGLENVELWHERDISHSSVERVILPDSSIAAHYMVVQYGRVVESLEIRPDRMLENLSASKGLIFSGAVLTALIDAGMSRERAYERVQAASMRARREGAALRDLLADDPEVAGLLGRGLDEAFELGRHLAHTGTVLDRLGIAAGDGALAKGRPRDAKRAGAGKVARKRRSGRR